MIKAHQAIKGATWNYLNRTTELGLLFLASALIARTLGPEKDSIFTLFSSLVGVTVSFTGLGIDWIVYKYIPQFTSIGKSTEASALLRRTFIIRLLSAFAGALTIYALIATFNFTFLSPYKLLLPYLVFTVLYIIGQNIALFGTAVLTSTLRTKEVLFINSTVKLFLIALLAWAAYSSLLSPNIAIISVTGAACVTGMIYIYYLIPIIRGNRVPVEYAPIIMFGAVLLGNDVLSFLLGRYSDILVLSYWFPGSPQVSIYDKAFQAGIVVEFSVMAGLSGVLFTVFAELAVRARERLNEAHQRVLAITQMVFIPVAVFVVFFAPAIIGLIYGSNYAPAVLLFRIFLILDVIDVGVFGGGMNITLLNTISLEKTAFRNRCLWGITNLAVNLYLIPHYGILSALVTTRGCNLCAVAVEYFIVRRAIGGTYMFRWLVTAIIAAGIGLAGISLLSGDSLFNCLIGGFIFVLLVVALYFVMKPAPMKWALQVIRIRQTNNASV